MKKVNKDNRMKKFKYVLGMAALALAGNAFAELPELPKVPAAARVINVVSRSSWDSLSLYIQGYSSSDLVLKVSGDIKFSDAVAIPNSTGDEYLDVVVDAKGKNIYIVGDNHSLSGIILKGEGASLFKNVNNLYIENLNFKNCYLLPSPASGEDFGRTAFLTESTKASFYLNNVSFENVGMKGIQGNPPQFSNAAFLVASVKMNAVISHVSVKGLTIDSLSADTLGGLIGRANNVLIEESHLNSVSVKNKVPTSGVSQTASFWTGGIIGIIPGSYDFKMQNSSISLTSLEFAAADYRGRSIIGGIVGESDDARIELVGDSVSGKINVVNNVPANSAVAESTSDFLIGGAFGYWHSERTETNTLQMDYCISNVNISVNSEQKHVYTARHDELTIPPSTSVGGFVGSLTVPNNIVVMNYSVFSGNIDYKAKNDVNAALGGFVGTYANGSITLNEDVVKGVSIKYNGAFANVGGLLGYASRANEVNVKSFTMEKDIQATLSPVTGASIGGVVGLLSSVPLKLEKSSIQSDIVVNDNKNFEPVLTETQDLSVGGVVGFAGSSNDLISVNGQFMYGPRVSVELTNVDYNGRLSITRAFKGEDKNQYVGGFVGKSQDSRIAIEKSSVVGVNDTLMVTDFTGTDLYSPIKEGGFIGGSDHAFKLYSLNVAISESFVSGAIVVTGMKNSDTSYVSGFIGKYVDVASAKISDSYYRGALVTEKISPTPVVISGAISVSRAIDSVFVRNSYVYDSQAAADSLVHVQDGKQILSNVYLFSSLAALENTSVEPSSPAFAYLLNEDEDSPHWGYNANENEGLPQLGYIKGVTFKAPKKVTLLGFEAEGSSPVDIEIYTDSDGEWELSASGKRFSDNLNAVTYDPKKNKIVSWKQKDGDVVWAGLENTADDLRDGMVFEKTYADLPKVKFNVDYSGLDSKDGVLFMDESDYSLVDDDSLPWAVFALSDNNGKKSFYKGSFWKVAGTSLSVSSSEDVIQYVAQEQPSKLTLEFDLDSLKSLVKSNPDALKDYRFQTNLGVINVSGSLTVKYSSMGYEDTVSFNPQFVLLPKVEKLSVANLSSGSDTSTIAFVVSDSKGNTLYEEVLFNEDFDLSSVLSNDDVLTITAKGRTKKPEKDSSENQGSGSDDPSSPSTPTDPQTPADPTNPVVTPSSICADKVKIVDSRVAKSGTAALFAFTIDVTDVCKPFVNPHVFVSGPKKVLMDSTIAFSKTNEFVFYPLEPGAYTFKVKVAPEKTKTIKQYFSADIELRGRAWNMVAYGSWPKNVLKNAKPTIYTWNESNAIGEFWQYESFPKGKQADEMTGYWVRSESSLSFSLDLPLKKAESDSLSWTVEKKFSGWNLLANPYSWNLYVGSVADFKSSESGKAPIWHWNSDKARYDVTDTLFANEAFWVSTDKKRTLRVSTKPVFPAAKPAAKKNNSLFRSVSKNSWSMVLVASTDDGVSDSWNVFGVGSKDITIAEPPAGMESGVAVSFVEDNALLAKRILAKTSADEYSWNVKLNASKNEKVNLTLEGLDEVRAMGYRAVLVMDGKAYEWGESSTISVDASGSKTAELKVVPAKAQVALSKGIADMKYSVAAGQLAVNFSVPAEMAGKVAEVRLLDMNGNVLSMARGKAQAGTNDMRLGSVARNGVYVLMVRVGSATRSARIAL